MTIPVHETGWVVVYTGQWGNTMLKPVVGASWLSVDEARARFEEGKHFEVAEACDHNGDQVLRSRWVVGVTHPGWARAQFFNAGQSIIASISYEAMDDGRLFVGQRYDYVYPDQVNTYTRLDATTIYGAYYKPDGTGMFVVRDSATEQSMVTRFKDADFSSLWFDWAGFGNWDVFANPDDGTLPEDFAMTPL